MFKFFKNIRRKFAEFVLPRLLAMLCKTHPELVLNEAFGLNIDFNDDKDTKFHISIEKDGFNISDENDNFIKHITFEEFKDTLNGILH